MGKGWPKGKPRGKTWNKNIPMSAYVKQKLLESHLGIPLTEETKHKLSIRFTGEKNPFFGKSHTLETRKKISEKNMGKTSSFKGHHHTEKAKVKLSSDHTGKPLSPETREKIPIGNTGKKKSLEERKKISERNMGNQYWLGKKHREESKQKIRDRHYGIRPNEATRKKLREKRLLRITSFKDTKIERMLQDELSSREYAYYCHYPIIGQPDLAFPNQKIAIFCDGDYYHAYPGKYLEENICKGRLAKDIWKKDRKVSELLKQNGWLVLRYWEHEILGNAEQVVDEIEDCLMLR